MMKFLIQRVKEVRIILNGKEIEYLEDGFLIFVGVEKKDAERDLSLIKDKILSLRIGESDHKFTKPLKETGLPIMLISQITLIANFDKSGRVSFDESPQFEIAKDIFERFVDEIKKDYHKVKNAPFGSFLSIKNINVGPVNFFVEI
jgi:D-tyrosyl-tRNA(Tyr) deacylase